MLTRRVFGCSLSPPTLRNSMRCTKALPAIEVMADSRGQWEAKCCQFLGASEQQLLVKAKNMGALVQLYFRIGIPSVGPVPV